MTPTHPAGSDNMVEREALIAEAERIVAEQCAEWRWPDLAKEQLSEYWLAVEACTAGIVATRALAHPGSSDEAELCAAGEAVLAAMDKYNEANGTFLGGAPFFRLGRAIAASRVASLYPAQPVGELEGWREALTAFGLALMADMVGALREAQAGHLADRLASIASHKVAMTVAALASPPTNDEDRSRG